MARSSRTPYLFSSPSSSSAGSNYHVFLSFHGPDTRKGFTDHLYQRLITIGITSLFVFRDEESLPIGEDIRQQLLDAITRYKISIPILSENYASSEWCLMELTEMMKRKKISGHTVLPIFYKVTPAQVRRRRGKFGRAFLSLRKKLTNSKKFNIEEWKKWEEVLAEVCTLKGWESEKFADGYESKLVNDTVEKVLQELSKDFQLEVPEHLVGVDEHLEEIMRVAETSFIGTRVIGIYGMAGVGKTTLAKLVYNKLSCEFRYHSYIADIRESVEGEAKGIEHLQNQLIHDLLERNIEVRNVDEGTNILQIGLNGKKVLILLDDVTNKNQLVALFGEYNQYSSGSMIIITTQNRDVLNKRSFLYELLELSGDQSLILFSRYAFQCDSPPHEFEEISHHIVTTTGGLPLALRVIGSLLNREEDLEVWKETWKKLSKAPTNEVKHKLKLGYEKLDHKEQQIFLDIACFFVGIDIRIPLYMWESCNFYPRTAINVLMQHSLIRIGDKNEIQMHDQLRALGREVVLEEDYDEPKNRSRLWDYEAASRVLNGNEGIAKTRAIHLDETRRRQVTTYTGRPFKNLPNLRFLDVSNVNFDGDFQNSFSQLRWLRWKSHTWDSEVMNFNLEKLVILDLSRSCISKRWKGWHWIMMVNELKVLNLTNCFFLNGIPNLSTLKSLEILNLENCFNLMEIGSSIEDLKTLVCLNLGSCTNLQLLPPEVGNLEGLAELVIDNTTMEVFPEVIGNLKKLEVLSARGCTGLVEFPGLIETAARSRRRKSRLDVKLTSLTNLDLSCTTLLELTESIDHLRSLKILKICETNIRKLPGTIGRLWKLQVLLASNCRCLEGEIPYDLGELSSLKIFQIDGTNISSLPVSICKLSSLRLLDLSYCKKLRSLPVLPSGLESLLLTCEDDVLPQLSHLANLRELTLRNCKSIESILELPWKLSKLHIFDCDNLEILPNMSSLQYLSVLEVVRCSKLMEIEGLEALTSLRTLDVCGCIRLSKLDGLKSLESLTDLNVGWCEGLDIAPSQKIDELFAFRGLDKLTHLDVS